MFIIRRFDTVDMFYRYLVFNSRIEYWTYDISKASKLSLSLAECVLPRYLFLNAELLEVS